MCKPFIRELLPGGAGKGIEETDQGHPSKGMISGKVLASNRLYRRALESKLQLRMCPNLRQGAGLS